MKCSMRVCLKAVEGQATCPSLHSCRDRLLTAAKKYFRWNLSQSCREKKSQKFEQQIADLELQKTKGEGELSLLENYSDSQKLSSLNATYETVKLSLEGISAEWEQLAEKIMSIEQ